MINNSFWQGKRVFVTGHTGFKGGWLSLWLQTMGATVKGYSLPPPRCLAYLRPHELPTGCNRKSVIFVIKTNY
ncbi:hypothetical protein F1520_02810 [Yersinia pestis]|nr:hypothetical protein F1520_02810 [Yersinia pestis]KAA5783186.1 hypothetical protein F1598_05170 [Yersinia pestis]KAA5816752.1 hypothetical protein F1600_05925 [Yersinia pestis]KAA5834080.1 hypothetical protein F1605_00965 [Yersinia pestis]PWF37260.1 hypothetical protein DBB30_01225 [Yersinia pestis]